MTARRFVIDAVLVLAVGVLTAGVVHDLRHQVTGIHHRQVDVRAFDRWAATRPIRVAYAGPHVVFTGHTIDRLCATRTDTHARVCVTIRHAGSRATVEGVR